MVGAGEVMKVESSNWIYLLTRMSVYTEVSPFMMFSLTSIRRKMAYRIEQITRESDKCIKLSDRVVRVDQRYC